MTFDPGTVVTTVLLVVEYAVKIVAIGTVPANRRPSSGQAWLLLILFLPVVGLPLFLLIGSPYVHGRRHRLQGEANKAIEAYTVSEPLLPATVPSTASAGTLVRLNRQLTSMPCVLGNSEGLHGDYEDSIAAITAAIRAARRYVHLEIYILALDPTTAPLFEAMADAVDRGVKVRVLYDHLGSRKYPGYHAMNDRLTRDGVHWYRMMPIDLLRRRWRRPDLRNHRKLVVIDGIRAFMGSQNMIDSSYLSRRNLRISRHWVDLNIELSGEIVRSLDAVFATDWYAESGQRPDDIGLELETGSSDHDGRTAFQLVPSGPGFPTEPNLRLFASLIYLAQDNIQIVSPYFVPDESLMAAITTAAYRGVRVDLYVSEKADQFMVHHAQRSFYHALLESGVRIHCYPAPDVLHTKLVTVDDRIGLIGSSNMDMRSFALDYEIMLLALDPEVAADLNRIVERYRQRCFELDLETWKTRPRLERYLDNALRLTAAVQ
ncbi:cardiolipin synthase [Microlunatus kandeliicorticis]|uniref:cardiolipin synthase n=1 Tax=Microlunatus kandeliicorticis TaxID=1759536 RepID=UPI001C71C5F7|nr:cardiolipin synthase [Microlunatus kandeliicorticis]